MSANTPNSSGVRNLRAMFENQNAASSPEPRGRSPAGSAASNTSRPTSKIRASFVSVEPSGFAARDLGTTKGTTDGVNSTAANRRESFSLSQDNGPNQEMVHELKKTISQEAEQRRKSDAIPEAIPEQAVSSRESSIPPPPIQEETTSAMGLGGIMKGSEFPAAQSAETQEKSKAVEVPESVASAVEEKKDIPAESSHDVPGDNPDKVTTGVQDEGAALRPSDPKDEAAVSGGQALPPPSEPLPSANTMKTTPKAAEDTGKQAPTAQASASSAAPTPKKANGTPVAPNSSAKATPKQSVQKPAPLSTSKDLKPSASKTQPKSPALSKAPRTPTTPTAASSKATSAKSPAVKSPAAAATKEEPKAPAAKPSRTSSRAASTSTTASAASKAKAPVRGTARPTTKPAAPASNTQTSPFRKPKPRSPTRPVRLPSHLTAPTASSAAKHGEEARDKPLARKPSTVSRPAPAKPSAPARKQPSRASMAPQPTKRPESRQSTVPASSSFLDRMMRPTTSSASKTHDKVNSPPRRASSVRAPTKPKTGHESLAAKGKRKVGEGVAKAKEAVTSNGTNGEASLAEESHDAPVTPTESTIADNGDSSIPEKHTETVGGETTPTEQAEPASSSGLLQTPQLEQEQTIR